MSPFPRCPALLLAAACCALALAGETPKGKAPVEEAKLVEFPFYNQDTGELEWLVRAAKVTADKANPRVLLGEKVRIIVYHKGKEQTTTAAKGRLDTQARLAMLEGNVVMNLVQGDQLTRVESNDLTWDGQNNVASTRGPVKISRPDMTVSGVGMRVWLSTLRDEKGKPRRTGHMVIERRVRAELLPGSGTSLLDAPTRRNPQPIIITCDGPLVVSHAELTTLFNKNVRATQGKQVLTCDRLAVVVQPVPGQKGQVALDLVTATGQVRLDDAKTVALADRAEWRRNEGSARLTGRPAEIRWDNGNRLTAGLVHRMGDGAEILCSSTPEYPHDVYLLAQTIQGIMPPDTATGAARLRVDDILHWPRLCAAIDTQAAAKGPSPGKRLWELLPGDARSIIRAAARGNMLGQQRKAEIAGTLNAILERPDFYRARDFAAVELPHAAADLLARGTANLAPEQTRRLNRLLLQAAFPGIVAPMKGRASPPEGKGSAR